MRFGMVKFFAHRAGTGHPVRMRDGSYDVFYEPVPLFANNKTNRAIYAHEERIRLAKTRKRKSPPSFSG